MASQDVINNTTTKPPIQASNVDITAHPIVIETTVIIIAVLFGFCVVMTLFSVAVSICYFDMADIVAFLVRIIDDAFPIQLISETYTRWKTDVRCYLFWKRILKTSQHICIDTSTNPRNVNVQPIYIYTGRQIVW